MQSNSYFRETSESLRREVAEQEAAWRARIAALEQRAHDEWLARRAAERSAEASAREAQALRQRLAAPSPDKRNKTRTVIIEAASLKLTPIYSLSKV